MRIFTNLVETTNNKCIKDLDEKLKNHTWSRHALVGSGLFKAINFTPLLAVAYGLGIMAIGLGKYLNEGEYKDDYSPTIGFIASITVALSAFVSLISTSMIRLAMYPCCNDESNQYR